MCRCLLKENHASELRKNHEAAFIQFSLLSSEGKRERMDWKGGIKGSVCEWMSRVKDTSGWKIFSILLCNKKQQAAATRQQAAALQQFAAQKLLLCCCCLLPYCWLKMLLSAANFWFPTIHWVIFHFFPLPLSFSSIFLNSTINNFFVEHCKCK